MHLSQPAIWISSLLSPYSGGESPHSAVYLSTMPALRSYNDPRRTDPGCLSNNGRGLRSDHNRENSATTLEGRLDRGGIRSIYEFSRLTLVLGPSKNGSWFMYGCGPHDVAWIKETRHVFVSFDRLSCSDYAFMDACWIRYVKDLLISSNFIARFHRFRRWEFVVQFRVWGIEIKMFFPLLLFRL